MCRHTQKQAKEMQKGAKMSIQRRIERQKLNSASRLEKLTGGLAPVTKFTSINLKVKRAQLKNFTSAFARYIAEEGRVGMLITLTFGKVGRIHLEQMQDAVIIESGEKQHKSLMSFLRKMRKSKRIKEDIRYISTTELQSDGNLHSHIFLSVAEDDYIGLIEFIYAFKQRYRVPYIFDGQEVYPIGRLHIGISSRYKKEILGRYVVQPFAAKSDPDRTENFIVSLESREFKSGNWTPIEFYSKKMMKDRYEELIVDYLVKTLDGEYALDEKYVKEGVAKCQLGHDTKAIFDDNYVTRLQVRFIRLVGKRLYTHSRLPFPFKLYQQHYKALVNYDKNYTIYWLCIEDFREGKLVVKGQHIFNADGYRIAPTSDKSIEGESYGE